METGVNEKTSNYLEARISNLSSYERNVVLIVDEIYTAQRVEYSSGKLHGIDDGQVTKTLLCFMVSSVAGPFQDVVCHQRLFTSTLIQCYKLQLMLV